MRLPQRLLRIALAAAAVRAFTLICLFFFGRAGVQSHHVESAVFIAAFLWLVCVAAACRQPEDATAQREAALLMPGAAVVCVAGAWLYWRALRVGLLSDDFVLMDWARRGEFVGASHVFVRPLPLVLWRTLLAMGGGAVAVHALNIGLHIFNAVATAMMTRTLRATRGAATVAGALFFVWPSQIEPVVWASGVFDVVCTTCILSVVLLLRTAGGRSWMRVALAVAVAAAAPLCKESALALPALLLLVLLDRWHAERERWTAVRGFLGVTAWCVGYGVWRVAVRPEAPGALHWTFSRYLATQQISRTFTTLAVPVSADSATSMPVVAASFAAVALGLAVVPRLVSVERRRADVMAVQGLAWCVVAALPAIGYLFIGPRLEASRYLYAAASGWAIYVAAGVDGFWQRGLAGRVLAGVAVASLSVAAIGESSRLLRDWELAGAARDAILSSANDVSSRNECAAVTFTGIPEALGGAQLFRNGLKEAVASVPTARPSGGRACALYWDGRQFVLRR